MSDGNSSGLGLFSAILSQHAAKITELERKVEALTDLVARLEKERVPKKPLFGRE